MPVNPVYPVFVSPDGEHEQVASSPAAQVRLRHAGWRLKTAPRSKKPRTGGDTGRPPLPAQTADS